jgi:hypothetical protein
LTETFVGCPRRSSQVALGHTKDALVPGYELDHTGKGAGDVYSAVGDLGRWNRSVIDALDPQAIARSLLGENPRLIAPRT